jgi:hypothetical protein
MHHIISIDASPSQLSKLKKGRLVRVRRGTGFNVIVHPETYKLASRAFKKDKGFQIALSQQELEANRDLSPEAHTELKEANPEISMQGQGIFGKDFDKLLKKAGVKELAYKLGDEFKPKAKTAITAGLTAGATALGTVAPELIPFLPAGVAGISTLAHDYLDRPGYYQKAVRKGMQGGVRGLIRSPVGQMAKKYAMSYANDRLNDHLGTNYDYMNRAGLENAAMSELNRRLVQEQLAEREALRPVEEIEQPHRRTYQSKGSGMHYGYHRRMEGGTVGRYGSLIDHTPPALMSQPLSANFQFQHFLPVQYQPYFRHGQGLYV